MLVSMVLMGFILMVLGVLYVKSVRAIEQDEINESMARAERFKNKRMSKKMAGA